MQTGLYCISKAIASRDLELVSNADTENGLPSIILHESCHWKTNLARERYSAVCSEFSESFFPISLQRVTMQRHPFKSADFAIDKRRLSSTV